MRYVNAYNAQSTLIPIIRNPHKVFLWKLQRLLSKVLKIEVAESIFLEMALLEGWLC